MDQPNFYKEKSFDPDWDADSKWSCQQKIVKRHINDILKGKNQVGLLFEDSIVVSSEWKSLHIN